MSLQVHLNELECRGKVLKQFKSLVLLICDDFAHQI